MFFNRTSFSHISTGFVLALSVLALTSCVSRLEKPGGNVAGGLSSSDGPQAAGALGRASGPIAARDRIVFGISWEPVSFNPLRALDSGSYYAQTLVYEGLIRYDAQLKLVPGLAESFKISDDGLTYSFVLRRNLKFSDDTAISLKDVAASIAAASSPSSPFKSDYKCIIKIDLNEADNSLVMNLKEPSASLLARLAELRILPARIMNQPDHGAQQLSRSPVASGPFKLRGWESGLELVFEPNPNYWGAKPQYKQLVWRIVPDKTLLGIALRRGELDVAAVDPLNCTATLRPRPQARFGRPLANESDSALDVEEFNGTRTVYLGFNVNKPPFDKALVRQAVCTGINRNELAKVLFAGYATVPKSDVSTGSWYYNPNVKEWPFDQRLSFALLQRAGYAYSNRGWYQADKQNSSIGGAKKSHAGQLAFRILTVKDFQDVAQVISDDLSQVGVATEVQVLEYTTLRAKYLKAGDFDVFLWSRSAGTDPECSLIWGTKGPLNFVNFSDAVVDKLIQEGRITTNRQKRSDIYGKIQQILADKLPWVFLVQPKLLIAHKPDIYNIKQAGQGLTGLPWDNPLFNAPRWERRNRE